MSDEASVGSEAIIDQSSDVLPRAAGNPHLGVDMNGNSLMYPGRPLSELLDNGLLWLINATTFHPYGKTLALHRGDDGSVTGYSIYASPEPWTFPDTPEFHAKARAAWAIMRADEGM